MQHEITAPQRLLDQAGNIAEPGFAKKQYWQYDRADIKAPRFRIKEWDYYYIGSQDYGLALTVSDAGYVSSLSISLLGFGDEPFQLNDGAMGMFPLGKLHLPYTSEKGDIAAAVGNADMSFANNGTERHLKGQFRNFCKSGEDLTFDILLTDIPEESMVIATPFDKKAHFYYNQKINCMAADGIVRFKGKEYVFRSENGAMGTLDWGAASGPTTIPGTGAADRCCSRTETDSVSISGTDSATHRQPAKTCCFITAVRIS